MYDGGEAFKHGRVWLIEWSDNFVAFITTGVIAEASAIHKRNYVQ